MVFNQYTVTYLDENGAVIQTDEVLFDGKNNSQPYTVNAPYTPKYQNQNFEWWIVVNLNEENWNYEPTNTTYVNEQEIDISWNLVLVAYAPEWHWLSFDENGKGASYTKPQFVKLDETPSEPSNPTRFGYEFWWWYENKACTEKDSTCTEADKFVFDSELEKLTVLYAKWNPNSEANYTVIVWKQNVAWDDYDFVESVTVKNAAVWSTPTAVDTTNWKVEGGTYDGEVWFHFKETDQANKKVATEGDTVVNVYFDRNLVYIQFKK